MFQVLVIDLGETLGRFVQSLKMRGVQVDHVAGVADTEVAPIQYQVVVLNTSGLGESLAQSLIENVSHKNLIVVRAGDDLVEIREKILKLVSPSGFQVSFAF